MDTVFEHSAGGIVLTDDGRLVILRTRNLKDEPVFALPKGHLHPGETARQAARREVTEETGYLVDHVTGPARTVSYWFVRDGIRVRKRVDFFRFVVVGGDPTDHDFEIDEVLALEPGEGAALLTYKSERTIALRALENRQEHGA